MCIWNLFKKKQTESEIITPSEDLEEELPIEPPRLVMPAMAVKPTGRYDTLAKFPEDAPYYVKYVGEDTDINNWMYNYQSNFSEIKLLSVLLEISTFYPETLFFVKDGYAIAKFSEGWNRGQITLRCSEKFDADLKILMKKLEAEDEKHKTKRKKK